ncbi:MAG: CBS domain-containing protein [Chloroflexi bacterium]|nr:CBS domain-containing protein [Chloroflexota bacterium]
MFVKSIMASKPRTTGAQEDVASAAKRMRENNVGCLIVVNSNAVQGIITDRDLTIGCLAEGHDSTRCMVSSHMSSPAVTVPPAMDVRTPRASWWRRT